uniref:HNH nuclease domain-containing protein n=1 Tax=mine drainage metagenome TaxID=410659 RepID=E6PCN4_9ZZZZ
MKIALQNVKVSDLVEGYEDKAEEGVRGHQGRLNIRPAYQREFIYKEKERNAVIETVRNDFPLNTMYWAVAGDEFELMDGQQRTISICQYVNGDFAVEFDGSPRFWSNLTNDQRQQILDYELSVYVCEGTESEKLAWFKIINIAGMKLTEQELRNAIYTGTWLADAKRWFSRTGAPAATIGNKLVTGTPIRQEFLETALDWISDGSIESYMAEHQHDPNATALWRYFQDVTTWVETTFTNYRKEMKSVAWGPLYGKFGKQTLDTVKLEMDVARLMQDDDVTKKSGIYDYVLSGNERALNIRQFSENMRREAYERQAGVCPVCGAHFEIGDMEADHITPWSQNGRTNALNCQMLCKDDNRKKSGK